MSKKYARYDRTANALLVLQQLNWQCPICKAQAKATAATTPSSVLTATITCEKGHVCRPSDGRRAHTTKARK